MLSACQLFPNIFDRHPTNHCSGHTTKCVQVEYVFNDNVVIGVVVTEPKFMNPNRYSIYRDSLLDDLFDESIRNQTMSSVMLVPSGKENVLPYFPENIPTVVMKPMMFNSSFGHHVAYANAPQEVQEIHSSQPNLMPLGVFPGVVREPRPNIIHVLRPKPGFKRKKGLPRTSDGTGDQTNLNRQPLA